MQLSDQTPEARRSHWAATFGPLLLSVSSTRHGAELEVPSARRAEARVLVDRFVAVERQTCRPLCYAVSPDLGDGTFRVLIIGPSHAAHVLRWLLGLETSGPLALQ